MAKGKFEKKPVSQKRDSEKAAGGKPAAGDTTGKRKRKGSIWLKILIVLLSILLVLMMVAAVALDYVLGRLGKFDDIQAQNVDTTPITDEFDTDSTMEGQEDFASVDASDVTFETVEELESEGIINVMLIGQDARPGETRARSDSMILISLNKDKKAIQLTSFMRDTYVQIPGYLNNRLNVAYRYGGTELMNETFKLNFGINIDGNVMVDFEEFSTIIDMLGGVDIDLSSEEVSYMRNRGYSVSEGINHLDGDEALTFCRMRYVSGGDYGRTERQRRVLISLADSVRTSSLSTVLGLVDQLLGHIVTNLTDAQIVSYTATGLSMLAEGAEIQSMRIPADDAHYGAMIDGMSVLVPDLEMCREDLEEFIYSPD